MAAGGRGGRAARGREGGSHRAPRRYPRPRGRSFRSRWRAEPGAGARGQFPDPPLRPPLSRLARAPPQGTPACSQSAPASARSPPNHGALRPSAGGPSAGRTRTRAGHSANDSAGWWADAVASPMEARSGGRVPGSRPMRAQSSDRAPRLGQWEHGASCGRGGGRSGAGRGCQDGVPDVPAGVPAGAARHPGLHHRLRPHHRRRGQYAAAGGRS